MKIEGKPALGDEKLSRFQEFFLQRKIQRIFFKL